MGTRKHQKHGQLRYKKKNVTIDGLGTCCATASIDVSSGEIFEFNTCACTASCITLSVTGLYDGAKVYLDFDSNVACDALTIQADDGVGDTVLSSGSFDDNARNYIEIHVLKAEKGAAELAVRYATIS